MHIDDRIIIQLNRAEAVLKNLQEIIEPYGPNRFGIEASLQETIDKIKAMRITTEAGRGAY